MVESRHEKKCLCDLRITNALRCQGSVIHTVPISEIPRLLQAYVDEGTGLSCFLVMQIIRNYLSRTDAIKPSLFFFFFFQIFMLYFQRIPFRDYFVNF